MFDASKRKNEDKPGGLPRHRIVIVGLFMAFVLTLAGVFWRVRSYPNAIHTPPTGHIIYMRDDAPMVINLQTRARAPYGYMPERSVDGQPLISPNGRWSLDWYITSLQKSVQYITLHDSWGIEEARIIGPYYTYTPDPVWSPDSQSVFFSAFPPPVNKNTFDEHKEELWRFNVTAQRAERLTDNADADRDPKISPDGAKLAWIAVLNGGYNRLHVMDLKTGQSLMPAPDMFVFSFSWSPDSQWFAVEADHSTNKSNIWLLRADGSELQALAIEQTVREQDPIWKP